MMGDRLGGRGGRQPVEVADLDAKMKYENEI